MIYDILSIVLSMIQTFANRLNDVIIRPNSFFNNMEIKGGYKDPLVFSYLVFFAVTILGVVLYLLGMPQMIVPVDLEKELKLKDLYSILLMSPLLWGGGIFVMSSLYHMGFKIVGGVGEYEATYRIIAYTSVTYIFNLIPRIGVFINCCYSLCLIILGGSIIHKLSAGRAIVGTLIPIFLIMFVLALALSSK